MSSSSGTEAFIERWRGVTASELSTAQSFVRELCDLLQVPKPHPTPERDYMFERPVEFQHGDGAISAGRIDCYKRAFAGAGPGAGGAAGRVDRVGL